MMSLLSRICAPRPSPDRCGACLTWPSRCARTGGSRTVCIMAVMLITLVATMMGELTIVHMVNSVLPVGVGVACRGAVKIAAAAHSHVFRVGLAGAVRARLRLALAALSAGIDHVACAHMRTHAQERTSARAQRTAVTGG